MLDPSAFILAIDFGLTNIGIAVGQKVTNTASELTTLKAKNGHPNWTEVQELVKTYSPSLLLVGYPLNMDGSESEMSKRVRKFTAKLEQVTNTSTKLVDERLSSKEAKTLAENRGLKNNSDYALYKSANTDVIGLIIEKISGIPLRDWVLSTVEAAGFEDGLYIASDRYGMPWLSGGGCLITRDFLRMGLLFARKGKGVGKRQIGSAKFLNQTIKNICPKYMELSKNKYLYYSNSTMTSGNVIGHSGYGGQYLAINLKTGNVAAFFSVLETKSATKESYKKDMINMLIDIVNDKY